MLPLARQAPITPAFATAVAGDGFVKVTWGESQRANHFIVSRKIIGVEDRFGDKLRQSASDPHLFIDRDVSNGKTYQYQVVAVNESGNSEPATTAEVTPRAQVQPDGMFEVAQPSGTRSLGDSGMGSLTERAVSPEGHLGDNVYNATGVGQTWSVQALRGQTITFNLRIQNDGKVRDTLVSGTRWSSAAPKRATAGA